MRVLYYWIFRLFLAVLTVLRLIGAAQPAPDLSAPAAADELIKYSDL